MQKFLELLLKVIHRQQFLLVFGVVGLMAYFSYTAYQSEIQAFPEFTNVQVKVITLFPGKAAEEVERFVTRPLETATSGLPGLMNSRSVSLFGLSAITLTFDDNTLSRQARLDTQQRLRDANLPEGVQAELEPDASPLGEIYRYVIQGDLPVDELRMIQDWTIERELKGIPGVTDVVTFGGPTRTLNIRLDPKKIWQYNLSVEEVAQRLSQNNLNAGGGFIRRGEEAYLVRALGLYDSPESLLNAIVAKRGGAPLRVRDVGSVEFGHLPRLGQVGFGDRNDVVQGIVLMRRGEDSLRTLERVKEGIDRLNENLPKGVKIVKTYDRSELITRSTGTVVHNIVFGAGLVVTILLLAFGIKPWPLTLAVLLIIPISLLAAVFGVIQAGYVPNLISLGAVDFGIIVETAILASEALIAGLALQKTRDDRFIARTLADVFGPSLICALILIVAFIPIISLQQIEGRIFRPLGITLVSAVIGGQISAMLLIPWFARWMTPGQKEKTLFHRLSDHIIEKGLWLGQALAQLIQFPRLISAAVFGIVITLLFISAGKEFLPDLNEGSIWVRGRAPSTISMEKSAEIANEVRRRLREIPEVTTVVSQVGRPDDGTDSAGFDNIEFSVGLTPPETWKTARNIPGMIKACQKKLEGLEGVEFSFSQYLKDNIDEAVSGVKGELDFKIFGPDLKVLQQKAFEVAALLRSIPGAAEVSPQILTGQPEFRVEMIHSSLADLGVDVANAHVLVESAIRGREAGQILDPQNRVINLFVYPHQAPNLTATELMELPLSTNTGSKVTLNDVAKLKTIEGVARIFREKGERRVAITLSVRDRDVVSFVNEATQKIKQQLNLGEAYHFQWAGSFQNAGRAGQRLMLVVPLCFLTILLILRSWFNSWKKSLLLLWQIPFALLGGLALLDLAGLNLSISAAAGAIVLCGVSFLTGMMILTEFIKTGSAQSAVRNKGFGVVVSNAVAIIGLIPAAISTGVGAEISRPFALMIVGGLCTSLIFSLSLYAVLLEPTPQNEASKI